MNKKTIRLTEGELKNIIDNSVKRIIKESSYDEFGNFDEESHNGELTERLESEVDKLKRSVDNSILSIDRISQMSTDDGIKKAARLIINAYIKANRETSDLKRLISL